MTDKLIVVLDGGLVQHVTGTGSLVGCAVTIIDYDTDGSDPDEFTEVAQGDGMVADAFVRTEIVGKAEIPTADFATFRESPAPDPLRDAAPTMLVALKLMVQQAREVLDTLSDAGKDDVPEWVAAADAADLAIAQAEGTAKTIGGRKLVVPAYLLEVAELQHLADVAADVGKDGSDALLPALARDAAAEIEDRGPPRELTFREQHDARQAWAKTLTDEQMTAALYEMRDRGAAVAYYDAGGLETMFDDGRDFSDFMAEERDALEEAMCDAAREYADRNGPEAPDDDEDNEEEGRANG